MTKVDVKLKRTEPIEVRNMKNSDVGVIVEWMYGSYVGKVVKYFSVVDMLIEIGEGTCWWERASTMSLGCKVRLLDKITITEE
jgi:hypothetical protein